MKDLQTDQNAPPVVRVEDIVRLRRAFRKGVERLHFGGGTDAPPRIVIDFETTANAEECYAALRRVCCRYYRMPNSPITVACKIGKEMGD